MARMHNRIDIALQAAHEKVLGTGQTIATAPFATDRRN